MSSEDRSVPQRVQGAVNGAPEGKPTRETYQDLERAYDHFNSALFEGRLPACLITLRAKGSLGYFYWDRFQHSDGRRSHEIALNPEEFARHTIEQCLSTLVRMQVLMLQRISRTHSRPGYYNVDFAERMGRIGLGVKNTGTWGGAVTGDKVSHFILPGGPFAQAARALVDQNFRARWADRFLSPGERDWSIIEPPEDGAAAQDAVTANAVATSLVSMVEPGERNVVDMALDPSTAPDPVPGYAGSAPPPLTISPADFVRRPASVDPSKAKFMCPLCKAAAWGKRSLKLVCGECSVAMRRTDDARANAEPLPRRGSALEHLKWTSSTPH